jgi:uncharacterized repeat protein (TIGR03803 family)
MSPQPGWNWKLSRVLLVVTATFTSVILTLFAAPAAKAQSLQVLHNFTGGADGANPHAGVTLDHAGNIYGTAYAGGAGYGTAFKMKHEGSNWIFSPLYRFKGNPQNDGAGPDASLVIAPSGIIYGSTLSGGPYTFCQVFGGYTGCGTVFSLQPPATSPPSVFADWTETTIYQFTFDPDGAYPRNSIALDSTGDMYGTGSNGGTTLGVVWELYPSGNSWDELPIYTFPSIEDSPGAVPESGVVFGPDGKLYGTTSEYGHNYEQACCGAVFQLTHSQSGWTEATLYDFTDGNDGSTPYAGVIADAAGNLYGSTTTDGTGGGGTVYEISPSGSSWNFRTIYSFTGTPGIQVGPYDDLVMDSTGNLYGTTYLDGRYGWGNVFKLTPSGGSWTYTSLHDFTGGTDGGAPRCRLVFDSTGNLYGTTTIGGANGSGVVFELTP